MKLIVVIFIRGSMVEIIHNGRQWRVEPDIIGITEIWIRPDMGHAEFTLPGYRKFRYGRKLRRGDGVRKYPDM